MKKLLALLFTSMLALSAAAQAAPDPVAAAAEQERQRIFTERASLELDFDADEDACYKRFAVNNCLKEVQARRRAAMAGLRQREVALNDQLRRQRAADQLRKTEEKSSPQAQQEATERRTKALDDMKSREERTRTKANERDTLKQNEAANAADAAGKLKGIQERAQARAEKQAAVEEERQRYKAKQQEILERKASREREMRERTKPAAKPLPAPG